jgi:hypothetical protein
MLASSTSNRGLKGQQDHSLNLLCLIGFLHRSIVYLKSRDYLLTSHCLDVLTAASSGFCRFPSLRQSRIFCAAVLLPRSKYTSSHLLMSTHCLDDADLYIALMILKISTFFSSPQLPFSGFLRLLTLANKDSNCLR